MLLRSISEVNKSPIYSVKTDRMDITIDIGKGYIFIQQRWKYNWKTLSKLSPWTYKDKKNFHHKLDNLLWQQWSKRFILKMEGTSNIAETYKTKRLNVNFDIRWVLHNEHWSVNIRKIEKGKFKTSSVNWTHKIVNLDTEDLSLVIRKRKNKKYKQYPFSHEFGHAIGNTKHIKGMHGDEYSTSSVYKSDLKSRMNIGNDLRKRHLDYLISELNKMIPNTKFIIYELN